MGPGVEFSPGAGLTVPKTGSVRACREKLIPPCYYPILPSGSWCLCPATHKRPGEVGLPCLLGWEQADLPPSLPLETTHTLPVTKAGDTRGHLGGRPGTPGQSLLQRLHLQPSSSLRQVPPTGLMDKVCSGPQKVLLGLSASLLLAQQHSSSSCFSALAEVWSFFWPSSLVSGLRRC